MPVPVLAPFIAAAFSWVLREVVVKFMVLTAVFLLVGFLVPRAVGFLGDFISAGRLSSAFSQALGNSQICLVLSYLKLGYGVPLIISAYISRFLIRRLPVIG